MMAAGVILDFGKRRVIRPHFGLAESTGPTLKYDMPMPCRMMNFSAPPLNYSNVFSAMYSAVSFVNFMRLTYGSNGSTAPEYNKNVVLTFDNGQF